MIRDNALDIWMNGERCGRWIINRKGAHEFTYDRAWMDSPNARPISLSMPTGSEVLTHSGSKVESCFDNLLPDNSEIRRRIQARVGAASTNAMDLLRETGMDCVGAVQFLREEASPSGLKEIKGDALDEAGMAAKLRARIAPTAMGFADEDDFRISLAGAQEKTAFLKHGGIWHQPRGSTPSTHIFKFPLGRVGGFQGDYSTSIENEWLCAEIAREFGLPAAPSSIECFEDLRMLVVERFDRKPAPGGGWWLRLPQEDMCQALAIPKGIKYENEGGPGMGQILGLLLGSRESEADRIRFFKSLVLFWLLCAPDGHARNFSIFIEAGGRFTLTPLYDIISAYPVVGHGKNLLAEEKVKLAMSVQGKHKHGKWDRITRNHWKEAAHATGMGPAGERILGEIIGQAEGAVTRVGGRLPAGFPDSVSNPILEGLRGAAKRLAS